MCQPQPLFIYFHFFKHTLQFLQQINVKKCPSSIRCQDSNSRPLEHESPPITTRSGLPFGRLQSGQTGDRLYSVASPYEVSHGAL